MTAPGGDAGPDLDAGPDRDAAAAGEGGEPDPSDGDGQAGRTVPPEQSREDTDAAWGEYPAESADDRLYQDRPPHWDNY